MNEMEKVYTNKLVSVIMPVYNAERYLEETLDSVLSQTYEDIEIICVDDMSSDRSRDILEKYKEKSEKVKAIYLTENAGVANARNVAIQNAEGRFIAFLDSDDVWLPEKISRQIDFMLENKYEFTFTSYRFMDADSKLMNTVVEAKEELDYNKLLKHNAIACLTVVIDRNYVKEIVMPKTRHEDYATWLRILKQGHKAHGLNDLLALYRTRQNSLSGNKLKAATWTWNILRNEEKLGLLKSLYCFTNYALVNIFKHFLSK
ncbi:glycosyltransferase family 2 protein [Peptostreptococcus stomatis]|uniref:glycosyltransferase family 2 protein n=1 Tax=Peptostreptococcus stomatis TaxID=341694 RepID=UPI003F9F5E45